MGGRRRVTAAAVVLALLGVGSPALANHEEVEPRGTARACPGDLPDDGAPDVPTSNVHEGAIDCVAWWQIALGRANGTYDPATPVTRAQMASFVGRFGRAIGLWQWYVEDESNPFPDNGPGPHQYNVIRLTRLGVVQGRPDGLFHPDELVTRGQMAAFLVRTIEHEFVEFPPPVDAFHDDDGSVFEDAIGKLAAVGIVSGTADGSYRPDAPVPRDQMASFIARALDFTIEEGRTFLPGGGGGDPSAYRWRFEDDQGRPIRFDPCTPITYVVNAGRAPATGLDDLHEAFRRVGEAMGVTFTYGGPSTEIPDTEWYPEDAEGPTILVGWVTAGESDFLADGHGGHGTPIWSTRTVDGEPRSVSLHGFLALGADDVNVEGGFGPGYPWGALLLSQLGHLMGIQFGVDDQHSLMSRLYFPSADYGAGDLEGLRLLGVEGGCLTPD